ncbi:M24 family metallopeptidase [Streptomyces avermitilis]|uniref:M24 family metallopeptidase n=1 Tax=Streptomyces avermitilis TaxID=33903 RepID=UPI0033AB2EA0
MVEIKTDTALAAMREAGRVVADALAAGRAAAAVGVRLRELDEAARAVLAKAGARSPFLGYQPSFAPTPFPAVICASVNDAVSHGIADDYRLRDGDLVSIDCGAELGGWTGDAAISFTVGTPRPADLALVAATQQALDAGIAAATVGHRIGDISDVALMTSMVRVPSESGPSRAAQLSNRVTTSRSPLPPRSRPQLVAQASPASFWKPPPNRTPVRAGSDLLPFCLPCPHEIEDCPGTVPGH